MLKSFEFDAELLGKKTAVSYAPVGLNLGTAFTIRGLDPEAAHKLCHQLWQTCPVCGRKNPEPDDVGAWVPMESPTVSFKRENHGACRDEHRSLVISRTGEWHCYRCLASGRGTIVEIMRDQVRLYGPPAPPAEIPKPAPPETPPQNPPSNALGSPRIDDTPKTRPSPPPPSGDAVFADLAEDAARVENLPDAETATYPDNCTHDSGSARAGECLECGARDCPEGEPLHYHHDGCPACIHAADEAIPVAPAEIKAQVAELVDEAAAAESCWQHPFVDPISFEEFWIDFEQGEELCPIFQHDEDKRTLVAVTPRTFAFLHASLRGTRAAFDKKGSARKKQADKEGVRDSDGFGVARDVLKVKDDRIAAIEKWVTEKYGAADVQHAIATYEPKLYRHEDALLPLPPQEKAADRAKRLKVQDAPPAPERVVEGGPCKICQVVVSHETGSRLRDGSWKHVWDCSLPTDDGKGGNPQLSAAIVAMNPASVVTPLPDGKVLIHHDAPAPDVARVIPMPLPSQAVPQAELLPATPVALGQFKVDPKIFKAANFAAVVVTLVEAGVKTQEALLFACDALERILDEKGETRCTALVKVSGGGWRERLHLIVQKHYPDMPKE